MDYNKISDMNINDEETTNCVIDNEDTGKEETIGVVSNCENVYVRKYATCSCEALEVLPKDTEVVVDLENTVDGFYKIVTDSGVSGYIKKDFIEV